MWYYIFQIILFQALFLLVYDLFLKKETFFNWNRAYLLITSLLSFVLPFIKVRSFSSVMPNNYFVQLPEITLGNLQVSNSKQDFEIITNSSVSEFIINWEYLLYGGMLGFALFLSYKLIKIMYLINKNPKRWKGDMLIIKLPNSYSAFSFFHYVFIGNNIGDDERVLILKHEAVHVKEKHTLDLLFFELLKILFWFNPLIYIYQSKIASLHEYIADAKSIKTQDKKTYYTNLLSQVFEINKLSLVNPFFKQSLIKKRIDMLNKSRSKQRNLLKYTLLIPLVLAMLFYTSAEAQQNDTYGNLSDKQLMERFYKDLINLNKKGVSVDELYDEFSMGSGLTKYIESREEYYKSNAYLIYSFEKMMEKKLTQDDTISKNLIEVLDVLKNAKYQKYLEHKKTDKAKESWENNAFKEIRLVVDNLDNLTENEQEKYDNKLKMLYSDDWFRKFVITDGKNTKEIPNANYKPETTFEETEEILEVPLTVIDQAPIYPGCEDLSKEQQKKCISSKITEHVTANFNAKIFDSLGLKGRIRISTIFKINKQGEIEGVRTRAPYLVIENEAKRVLQMLPKMTPGKQKGKAVNVPYSLPIIFEIKK